MVVIEYVILLKDKIFEEVKYYCPLMLKFFNEQSNVYVFPRIMCFFLHGLFLGYLFWKSILLQIPFMPKVTKTFVSCSILVFATLFALSKYFRTITNLSLVGLCCKSGRSLLRALVVALLITGNGFLSILLVNTTSYFFLTHF